MQNCEENTRRWQSTMPLVHFFRSHGRMFLPATSPLWGRFWWRTQGTHTTSMLSRCVSYRGQRVPIVHQAGLHRSSFLNREAPSAILNLLSSMLPNNNERPNYDQIMGIHRLVWKQKPKLWTCFSTCGQGDTRAGVEAGTCRKVEVNT